MPRRRRLTPVALLIVSALALAGCGSDEKPSGRSVPATEAATGAEQETPGPEPGS